MNTKAIFVDDQGIWRENAQGERYGIAWDDVWKITGYKTDTLDALYTCVSLEAKGATRYLEIDDGCSGFEFAVKSISSQIPGIDPNWYSRLRKMPATGRKTEIWRAGLF